MSALSNPGLKFVHHDITPFDLFKGDVVKLLHENKKYGFNFRYGVQSFETCCNMIVMKLFKLMFLDVFYKGYTLDLHNISKTKYVSLSVNTFILLPEHLYRRINADKYSRFTRENRGCKLICEGRTLTTNFRSGSTLSKVIVDKVMYNIEHGLVDYINNKQYKIQYYWYFSEIFRSYRRLMCPDVMDKVLTEAMSNFVEIFHMNVPIKIKMTDSELFTIHISSDNFGLKDLHKTKIAKEFAKKKIHGEEWDGYYYVSLTENQYKKLRSSDVLENKNYYKWVEATFNMKECGYIVVIRDLQKHPMYGRDKIYIEKYETREYKHIYERTSNGFVFVNNGFKCPYRCA